MAEPGSDAEKLQRLREEREATEAAKWEDQARKRKALSRRTCLIGAGMCLLVGLFLGSDLLLLLPAAVVFAGGSCWLSIRAGLSSMTSGIILGLVTTVIVILTGGSHLIYAPVLSMPLGYAVFLSYRGEAQMRL